MEPDDFAMMEAVRADRADAFETLVKRYQKRLYRLAFGYLRNHEDALDAVQETMVKVYLARERYTPRSHPFTWVSRILANHCIDQIRRRRVRPMESLDHDMPPGETGGDRTPGSSADPHIEHERHALRREVERAVADLPDTQREVFVLRHFEEMSLEEIAVARGCALGTVKSSLHRAAAAVRSRILRSRTGVREPCA